MQKTGYKVNNGQMSNQLKLDFDCTIEVLYEIGILLTIETISNGLTKICHILPESFIPLL